jgi:RNA polymerase sigma factor (sigma-70 family)
MSARIQSIPADSSDDPVVNSLIDFAKNGFGDTQMFGLVARWAELLKRGGGALKVTLDEAALVTETRSEELLDLDEALESLAAQDPRKSQIVELRYFGGLSIKETAEFLKLSQRTVEREWTAAKAWLYRELSEEET